MDVRWVTIDDHGPDQGGGLDEIQARPWPAHHWERYQESVQDGRHG